MMSTSKMFHKKVGKTLEGIRSEYNEYKCSIRQVRKNFNSVDKLHNCLWYRIRLIVDKIFRRSFQCY